MTKDQISTLTAIYNQLLTYQAEFEKTLRIEYQLDNLMTKYLKKKNLEENTLDLFYARRVM